MFRSRTQIVRELVATEQSYVEYVSLLIELYMTPMLKHRVLTIDESKTLFPSIESIYNVNATLLKSLERRLEVWSFHAKLGDIFVAMVDFLKVRFGSVRFGSVRFVLLLIFATDLFGICVVVRQRAAPARRERRQFGGISRRLQCGVQRSSLARQRLTIVAHHADSTSGALRK